MPVSRLLCMCATILFASLWLLPTLAHAATLYVKAGSSCSGSGSSSRPLCTLQRAVDKARPGDTIKVRSGTYNEMVVAKRSGSKGRPITIKADGRSRPVLTNNGRNKRVGAITIEGSYWTIEGLTFDGKNKQTSRYAILLYARRSHIQGVKVSNNTIRNWGGTGRNTLWAAGIAALSRSTTLVKNSVIQGNKIFDSATQGIRLTRTNQVSVVRNTIQSIHCGRVNSQLSAVGIKDSQRSRFNKIMNNNVSNIGKKCSGKSRLVGIYCDTGARDGDVIGNNVSNIDVQNKFESSGIYMESRCHGWSVRHNNVKDIGRYSLRNGSPSTGSPNNVDWIDNDVRNAREVAMMVTKGSNLVVQRNYFGHKGKTGIRFSKVASKSGHRIDNNVYSDGRNGSKIGHWVNRGGVKSLKSWQKLCGCDRNSRVRK